jgi:hypothetical protein
MNRSSQTGIKILPGAERLEIMECPEFMEGELFEVNDDSTRMIIYAMIGSLLAWIILGIIGVIFQSRIKQNGEHK